MVGNPYDREALRRRDGGSHRYVFDIPLDRVKSNAVNGFHAYWLGKARGKAGGRPRGAEPGQPAAGALPARADIDPAEIKWILPDMALLNVEWDPFRCSMRLRGTRAEQFRPKHSTKYLDEATTFEPGRREDYLAEMKFVATQRRPAFARDFLTTRSGLVRDIWAGVWPLAPLGERVNMLVVIEDFAGLDAPDFDLGDPA